MQMDLLYKGESSLVRIFDHTTGAIEKALDFSTVKNKAISQNIANVDTPNYNAKQIEFKNVLKQAKEEVFNAKKTEEKHMSFTESNQAFSVKTNKGTMYNHNGNNVDVDKEMSNLAENQIYYNSMVDRFNGKMNDLQTVIRGGS